MRKAVSLVVWVAMLSPLSSGAVTREQCIQVALENNPDLQAAAQRVEAARAAIAEARSAYYPQITLSSMYSRSDNPPQAFFMDLNQRTASLQRDFNNPPDTENLRASVWAKIRLADGGQRGLGKDMAVLGTEASKAGEAAVRNELIYQVNRGYYGVLEAQSFVKVQKETVESLEESLRIANERFKAGSAVKTDVLNLEVKLAQAQQDLISAQNGFQLAVAALNTAIGQDLVPAEPLPDEARKELQAPDMTESPDAVENRPELKAAKANAEIQRKAWKKAQRDYYPTLSAFGSSDWDSDVSTDFQQSYFVGVVAEWDVFTGFRRSAATKSAKANADAARAEEDKARNNLRLDLKQAILQTKDAWERLNVARRSVDSAEEALRITRERYQQGAADLPELLTAEVGLTGTRTRDVAAYYDYLTAQSNVARAKGESADAFSGGGQ